MMIRDLLKLVLGLLMMAALLGCGRDDKGPVELNLIGEGLTPFEAIQPLSEDFTQQTGISVKIHPYEFETALKKTLLDFTAGTAQYDVVMGIYFNLGKYAELGEILPLQPYYDDGTLNDPEVKLESFFKPVMDFSCYYDDTLYGLPATAQTMYLWYRKDLFGDPAEQAAFREQLGYPLPQPDAEHPISWRQYRDLAYFFTRPAGSTLAGEVLEQDFYGTTIQARRHPAVWYEFANYLYSFGGHIFDPETGDVVIDSPEAKKALRFYLSLRECSPPGAPQFTWDDALSLFQQGRLALVTMWFDSSPALERPDESRVAGKVGYAPNPYNEETGVLACQYGGWAFYINADTPHPKEAYRLIEWLNRPDIQERWAALGGLPATISTFESEEYRRSPRRMAEQASLQHATAWSRRPYSSEVLSLGAEAISSAAVGQRSPDEALTLLAKKIRRRVGRAR